MVSDSGEVSSLVVSLRPWLPLMAMAPLYESGVLGPLNAPFYD